VSPNRGARTTFCLVPLKGGPPLDVWRPLYVVGRAEHCDIQIPHRAVSKVHAVLLNVDGVLFVRDLASTNGTRVNGQRVRMGALLPDDRLSFANVTFVVKVQPASQGERPELERTEQVNPEQVNLSTPAGACSDPPVRGSLPRSRNSP
jgi:pSer/pThr/pTyr-binding forkhead associated (FHA) protein